MTESTAVAVLPVAPNRKTYIGGSDAAAILGVSKWKTPLQLWEQKLGLVEPDADDEARKYKLFRRGKQREPFIIANMVEDYGVTVTRISTPDSPNRYTDPTFEFIKAEIDFEFEVTADLVDSLPAGFIDPALIGTIQNGEAKSVHPFAGHLWGDEFTDEVPIEYAAQSMHGLMVAGRQLCLYAVEVGDNLVLYKVERDDETIEALRKKELDFWTINIVEELPPDPINMDDMMKLFAKINGKPVDIDDETRGLLYNYTTIKGQIGMLAGQAEDLKFRICNFVRLAWGASPDEDMQIDDANLLYEKKPVATWKKQSSARIDTDALKSAKPEIAREFTRTTWTRVFRPKKL